MGEKNEDEEENERISFTQIISSIPAIVSGVTLIKLEERKNFQIKESFHFLYKEP